MLLTAALDSHHSIAQTREHYGETFELPATDAECRDKLRLYRQDLLPDKVRR